MQKDQLQLQEREIQNLQVALRLQQGENNRLRDDMDTKQYEKDVQLKWVAFTHTPYKNLFEVNMNVIYFKIDYLPPKTINPRS